MCNEGGTKYQVKNLSSFIHITKGISNSTDLLMGHYIAYLHQLLNDISAEDMVKDHLKKGVCHQVKLQSVSVPDQYGALLQCGHGHL